MRGVENFRITLMCAEKDPLQCHRSLLISRQLNALGCDVKHIHEDGALETHKEAVSRLVSEMERETPHLFLRNLSDAERISLAYKVRSEQIAYYNPSLAKTKASEFIRSDRWR